MTVTATKILNIAGQYMGVTMGSAQHRAIIDKYNSVKPLPEGYKVGYHDNWCDTFVSFVGIVAGATKLIGRECGVERHIKIFKEMGIWNENGSTTPKAGDIICYNWDDGTQPNDGWADHIGFVETVADGVIITIEGNSSKMVKRNKIPVGYGYIRGFARPKYGTDSKPSTPSKPTPSDPKKKVKENGKWDSDFTKVLQAIYGSGTIDGVVSGQIRGSWNKNISAAQWGSGGSNLIRVFQMRLRDKGLYNGPIDGNAGPNTIKGVQKALKTQVDGVISPVSSMVLAFQKAVNQNKLPF